jgi:hypothetical protein
MTPDAPSVMDDMVSVIDSSGRTRQRIRDDPGFTTAAARSSFAVLMAGAARHTLAGQPSLVAGTSHG